MSNTTEKLFKHIEKLGYYIKESKDESFTIVKGNKILLIPKNEILKLETPLIEYHLKNIFDSMKEGTTFKKEVIK